MTDNQKPRVNEVDVGTSIAFWIVLAIVLLVPTILNVWGWVIGGCVAMGIINLGKRLFSGGSDAAGS